MTNSADALFVSLNVHLKSAFSKTQDELFVLPLIKLKSSQEANTIK